MNPSHPRKSIHTNLQVASHYDICIDVRDALRTPCAFASEGAVTVLRELVSNRVVQDSRNSVRNDRESWRKALGG